MDLFVAIDGGGTKTLCWVADETRVLGRSVCGSVKMMNVGEEVATSRLKELVEEALAAAGVTGEQLVGTCVGLAGASSGTVRQWAEMTLRGVVGGRVEICGDEEIALDAAFREGAGVFVICGTGVNVVGRCEDGRRVTAGGWGPVLGDEGSGQWIGLEGIRAGLRARDRGVSTTVLEEVQAFWGLRDLGELVAVGNAQPRPAFSELATVVVRCAEAGDAVALDVLTRAGVELAELVRLVVGKMKAMGCGVERVAFTGSVLEKSAVVRRAMEAGLPGLVVNREATEPLVGALWRARKARISDKG